MQSCFSVCCAWFQKKPKPNKTVKLTLYHRTEVLRARYTDVDPSNEPNRPHISSDIINVKEHTSRDNNQQMRQIPDAPADQNPINATVFPMRPTISPARPSASPPRFPSNPASPPSRPVCPRSASAPPVKGVLSPVAQSRKRFFDVFMKFSRKIDIFVLHHNVRSNIFSESPSFRVHFSRLTYCLSASATVRYLYIDARLRETTRPHAASTYFESESRTANCRAQP
ncbi:hypothetical protein PhaeoP128_00615 [Phaeobacter gallaeciensis]|nr:hypothetical protein PhaeoP129_00615 [Phaeobacter gallaeciensis]ATF21384.1 hypothetical protein PhaeoP128_00615 [Phaeobacter gallaeciensis]